MKSENIKRALNIERISSALIGFPLVVVIIVLGNKYITSIGFALIALIAINEYIQAVSEKSKPIKWILYLMCILIAVIPTIPEHLYGNVFLISIPIIFIILFLQIIITNMKTNFNDLVYTFAGIIYVIFFISAMTMVTCLQDGKILIWYIILSGWATDVFAYLIGKRFGKHKFSSVSPKKSIEGCIAGVIGAVISTIVYTFFINTYTAISYSYLQIAIITIALSIIGQIGDFAASTIKRYVNIKDFGNLIPGHGGMLDRIDSIIFIAPFAYFLLKIL